MPSSKADNQVKHVRFDAKGGLKRMQENISPIKQTQSYSEYEDEKKKGMLQTKEI